MRALKLVGGVIYPVAMFGGLLFGFAWTLHWPRAWIFIAVIAALSTATMAAVFATRPELLDERYKPPIQRGQPLADKIITPLVVLTFAAQLAFIPRDVFHYALLGHPSRPISLAGLALFVAGWLLIALAFRANAFAAPIVKHQDDRGQLVVDRGPYRVVRHPMYTAALLMFVGMPLWLGSYAGAIAAIVPALPLVARIVVEERTLRRELTGYTDYTTRVRWRLVPGLW
jgi:protein-S-isoprenylcysteine O-methyltransferase Ste14